MCVDGRFSQIRSHIVTVILIEELVSAAVNCIEYQFATPFSYVGESCEDI